MGRCQPGQFKGRSLRVLRRDQPVVAQTTRAVMTATSEPYDVIVVGGGISGGWLTLSSVLTRCWGFFCLFVFAVVFAGSGRDLLHETTVAGVSFVAPRSLNCAASAAGEPSSSATHLGLDAPSCLITLMSSCPPLYGNGAAC